MYIHMSMWLSTCTVIQVRKTTKHHGLKARSNRLFYSRIFCPNLSSRDGNWAETLTHFLEWMESWLRAVQGKSAGPGSPFSRCAVRLRRKSPCERDWRLLQSTSASTTSQDVRPAKNTKHSERVAPLCGAATIPSDVSEMKPLRWSAVEAA